MFVNKFQINVNSISGATASTINIPISIRYELIDQTELIKKQFIDSEIEKNINPILDYEKVRFIPIDSLNNMFDNVVYNITFNSGINNYAGIGFTDDDIKFRRNNFKLSFLKLKFYDSDQPTNQNLISFITLYPKITDVDLQPLNVLPPLVPSSIKSANQIFTKFILDNPLYKSNGNFEGFYLYYFKDDITTTLPKELYMKASFNNVKNGKIINLMTVNIPQTIDNLVNKLYTKYILKRNNNGFFYELDTTYSNNITIIGNILTINLYQIQSL